MRCTLRKMVMIPLLTILFSISAVAESQPLWITSADALMQECKSMVKGYEQKTWEIIKTVSYKAPTAKDAKNSALVAAYDESYGQITKTVNHDTYNSHDILSTTIIDAEGYYSVRVLGTAGTIGYSEYLAAVRDFVINCKGKEFTVFCAVYGNDKKGTVHTKVFATLKDVAKFDWKQLGDVTFFEIAGFPPKENALVQMGPSFVGEVRENGQVTYNCTMAVTWNKKEMASAVSKAITKVMNAANDATPYLKEAAKSAYNELFN